MVDCTSSTKEPISRPRTLQVITIRLWPHSRVIVEGPSMILISAILERGILSPVAAGSCIDPTDSGLFRQESGNRIAKGKRNCPSTISPKGLEPIDSTRSSTALAGIP